jgi:GGDEF domain-containing protein
VTREAISQVSDGICGEINKDQKHFLAMSIEEIDRLSRLIENLLDISKIEAHKNELRKELIDIVALVKETSYGFAGACRNKGIEIRAKFSNKKIEIYAEKDRIIEVFVNLLSNALKFTFSGYIEVVITDKPNAVECVVLDTGKGIAKEALPKVFNKLWRAETEFKSAGQGSGLGLSISKEIIQMHGGKIWIESVLHRGTKVTFSLPKHSSQGLFKDYLSAGLAEAIRGGLSLSAAIFEVKDYDLLQKKIGLEKMVTLLDELERLVKTCLRRKTDTSVRNNQALLVLLPDTNKNDAYLTAERLKSSLLDYLSKEKFSKEIKIDFRIINFPEDVQTTAEFIKALQL